MANSTLSLKVSTCDNMFPTLNHAWVSTIDEVLILGSLVDVRGHKTKEIVGHTVSFPMEQAILTVKSREISYDFMFAEAHWIVSGKNWLSFLLDSAPSYYRFSDDGVRLNGAYGPKIMDQLSYVVETLINDPYSRQAVINIWRERPGPSKDIPCTLSVQFMIRDSRIHTHVTMRSNDVWLGMPYDAFAMTMVTCLIGIELNRRNGHKLSLGNMHHTAASRHIYLKDEEKCKMALHMVQHAADQVTDPVAIDLKSMSTALANSEEFVRALYARAHHRSTITPELLRFLPWLNYGIPNAG